MHLAALFDMDGLLIDSERAIMDCWLAVARDFGVALTHETYLAVVGRNARESDEIFAGVFGGWATYRQADEAVQRALAGRTARGGYPVKPGAKELLEILAARGVPCAVASSSSRHEIETRLEAAGVRHRFASVAGGDEVSRGKPDPAVYVLAAGRLGVEAGRCLAFEDSPNGARAALAAGASLALVPDLVAPPAELASRSLCVLASLEEAVPHVPRWFGPAEA